MLITQNGRRAVLYRNDQQLGHHWLRVRLVGSGDNRDAIGARLVLSAGGSSQYRDLVPTRSYLSQVELPVTFGLGRHTTVDALDITWPDGTRQSLTPTAVDTTLIVRQAGAAS